VERLSFVLVALGALLSCAPEGQAAYRAWDPAFQHLPDGAETAVTALWVSNYREELGTGRFERTSSWGQVPEKLVPDGLGGFTVAVPVLVQGETSDGPEPDRFETVLVRVVRAGDRFALAPNDDLPGEVRGWHDPGRRTVWFRGRTGDSGGPRILWQFHGRY